MIRRHLVIERGGIRFGIFGLLGKEAQFYTGGGGAVKFADPIETAKEMVKVLRETEKVDIIIALSHGGLEKGQDGRFTDGEDVRLPKAVPGIDVVIGSHSHTELHEALIVNGRTPVVQTGKYGENLGELVITLDGDKLTVESYKLHPVDDTIAGRPSHRRRDRQVQEDGHRSRIRVARLQHRSAAGGGAAGHSQYVCTDIAASTLLANLITDAFRSATQGGHRFHRQRDDARRLDPGEVRRADGLRRVRRWRRSAPVSWIRPPAAHS